MLRKYRRYGTRGSAAALAQTHCRDLYYDDTTYPELVFASGIAAEITMQLTSNLKTIKNDAGGIAAGEIRDCKLSQAA